MYESSLLGAGIGGVLGAFGAYVLGNFTLWRRVRQLESEITRVDQRVDSVANYARGLRGNEARAEQSAELETAVAEAIGIWQGEGDQNAKMVELGKLALKYPALRKILMSRLGVKL